MPRHAGPGRPKWIPQAADIAAVERMAGQGMSQQEIAVNLGKSDVTIARRLQDNAVFLAAYTRGRNNTIDKVTGWLMQVMENPSDKALGARVQAVKFWLMHVAGWREKQEHTGEGGGPMLVEAIKARVNPKARKGADKILRDATK